MVPTFGGSGLLRERIEKGEKADLFLSADLGSPRKLAADAKTVVPAIAFSRNRMCVVSRSRPRVTAANLVDRCSPKARLENLNTRSRDPAGDYAWSIFDRIEALRARCGRRPQGESTGDDECHGSACQPGSKCCRGAVPSNKIDVSITYCSAAAALEKDMPGLDSMQMPAQV